MSIKDKYHVQPIKKYECKEWLLEKHYAKRVPSISYAFGLYDGLLLIGICTYGQPPRVMNDGESIFTDYRVQTVELNRLCVAENLEKNVLSFFVGQTLSLLPRPLCVVSYADTSRGHQGYIYQATNWVYTGLNQIHEKEWFDESGKEIHQRTLSDMGLTSAELKLQAGMSCGDYTKKHRYFQFLGDKREVRQMRSRLIYPIEPYPKGDNRRYDASYEPTVQTKLF